MRDERPFVATALMERRLDTTAAANNNNKVKSMATQLLAKFEENAPVQSTGLKRQVGQSQDERLMMVLLNRDDNEDFNNCISYAGLFTLFGSSFF